MIAASQSAVVPPRPGSGAELAALAARHVSLGANCEFGLVQRYCGAEPADLLRFAFVPLPGLVRQLTQRLAAFGSQAAISIETDANWQEFISGERSSGIRFHTDQRVGQRRVHDVIRQELRRLPLLARKLAAELRDGARTPVYSRAGMTDADCIALHDALRCCGGTRLLVATGAPVQTAAGSLRKLRNGLLVGYLDRVTPLTFARDPSLDVWLALLRTAETVFASRLHDGSQVRAAPDAFDIPADLPDASLWHARRALRTGKVSEARRWFAAYLSLAGHDVEIEQEITKLVGRIKRRRPATVTRAAA